VKLHVLAAICPDTLRPLTKAEVYRRAARQEQIRAEQARVAKASEAGEPPEMRRQVIDLRELRVATTEMAMACLCAAPFAFGLVVWQAVG
jgi:hypothetical protein